MVACRISYLISPLLYANGRSLFTPPRYSFKTLPPAYFKPIHNLPIVTPTKHILFEPSQIKQVNYNPIDEIVNSHRSDKFSVRNVITTIEKRVILETLKAQKAELVDQLKASQEAVINVPNLERFIKDMQDKFTTLDFEGKRLVLDMLGITVYLDGQSVEIAGVISPEDSGIVFKSSRCLFNVSEPITCLNFDGSSKSVSIILCTLYNLVAQI